MSNHDESTNYRAYPTLMPLPVQEAGVVPGNANGAAASGHDESVNYLAYPTLMPLPVQPDEEADPMQRLLEEKQRLAAELARIEAELQNMETPSIPQRPDTRQTSVHAEEGQKLLSVLQRQHTETVRKLLYVLGYALKQKQQQCDESEYTSKSKKQNVLGNVGNSESEISLDGVTAKKDITEIRFLNTLANAPKGAADISEAQDGGVLCWTEEGVQYIAGEGGVAGGSSCAYLFAGYKNVTAIHFDGNFDTSCVTDMSEMFRGCTYLKSLNLADWNTSSVIDMSEMFANCLSLHSLDLSGFDTSNVKYLVGMFYECWQLSAPDLSGWDTSNVTHMGWMFCDCRLLRMLNLSGWNTSNVKDMQSMFEGCDYLKTLDLSGWNTSNVKDMRRMFQGCRSLSGLKLGWLDTSRADTTDMYKGIR